MRPVIISDVRRAVGDAENAVEYMRAALRETDDHGLHYALMAAHVALLKALGFIEPFVKDQEAK